MAPWSRSNRRSSRVNTLVDLAKELDELADAQGLIKKSNAGSNKASTKALTPSEAPTPPLIPLPAKGLFTQFIKVFIETTQAQAPDQKLLEV